MITFVTGKPGDGKTMYGMKLIVDTLLHTERVIATNIAVKLPELRAYLILKGWKPRPGHDLAERFIFLDHEDVFEFYRFRSGGYVLPESPDWIASKEGEDEDGKRIKKLTRYKFLRYMTAQMREMKKHPRALRPVEYHIDEAHDYFASREWVSTGRGILWYASKHRHLHDEIILYTQVMKNVEGQLRDLASFTVRARNQLRMSWGPFRKAPVFRLYHYYGGPEDCDKVMAFNTGTMQLDREGLCRTYNTAGAISVHAKPEEVKNKAPLPYWALPVACGLLILLVVAFMAVLPLMAGKYAGARIKTASSETAKAMGVPVTQAPAPASAVASPQYVKSVGRDDVPAARQDVLAPVAPAAVELREPRVDGVMVMGETILVHIEGQEWSRFAADLGSGRWELANGVVVRKSDVLNVRKREKGPESSERNARVAATPRHGGED